MTNTYSRAYRILHWVMAGMILALLPVGLYMADLPDSAKNKDLLYAMHKSFGLLVLAFAFLRVFMRLKAGKVAPVATLTAFERKVSAAVHHLLFILLLIVPLCGYLMVSSCCAPLRLFSFGNFALPVHFGEKGEHILGLMHEMGAKLMLLLVLAHIGAALFHHFVKKDTVLTRMLCG